MKPLRVLAVAVGVAWLASGCAALKRTEGLPSPANAPAGGPRIAEPFSDNANATWGFNPFGGFNVRDSR